MSRARRRRAPSGFALLSAAEQAMRLSPIERVALLGARGRRMFFRGMSEARIEEFLAAWVSWARPGQLPPEGLWRI